jgi:uncharacterized protein YjbI with pentapeptide repeats
MEMPRCEHYEICGLDANHGEDLCILHSRNPTKSKKEFDEALAEHRKQRGDTFQYFVFPERANFSGVIFQSVDFRHARFEGQVDFHRAAFSSLILFSEAVFAGDADFTYVKFGEPVRANVGDAKFHGGVADFNDAKFNGKADFSGANFYDNARFSSVRFGEDVDFSDVNFARQADFSGSLFAGETGFYNATFGEADFCKSTFCRAGFSGGRFKKEAHFFCATFNAQADFYESEFTEGVNFSGIKFSEEKGAIFFGTKFLGRTLFFFTDEELTDPVSFGAEIDFRNVTIVPLDALIFRNAALQRCRFHDTDLRRAEFVDVKWPKKGGRFRVYDEDVELQKGKTREWAHVEQLYRQLKQNYEDRRDYARAGDFHYGEKEMRRRNPHTPSWLRWLLKVYRCVGGYGERCLPPFLWSIGLFVVCAGLYLCFGLRPKDLCSTPALTSVWGYFDYSLRVMTFLKPDDLVPIGCARYVTTFESLLGPILIGLFALALRQRLKR